MIALGSTLSPAREAGVVYTKPWMVELVLDLAGYLPEKRLAELVALEPSAGDGAFLSAMVRRLVESFSVWRGEFQCPEPALRRYFVRNSRLQN